MSPKSKHKHRRRRIEEETNGYRSRRPPHQRVDRHKKEKESSHRHHQRDNESHRRHQKRQAGGTRSNNEVQPNREYSYTTEDRSQHKIEVDGKLVHAYTIHDPRIRIPGIEQLAESSSLRNESDLIVIPQNVLPTWSTEPVLGLVVPRGSVKVYDPIPLPPFPADWPHYSTIPRNPQQTNIAQQPPPPPLCAQPEPKLQVPSRLNLERCTRVNLPKATHDLVSEFQSGRPSTIRLLPSKLDHLFIGEQRPTNVSAVRPSVFREPIIDHPVPKSLFSTPDPKRLSLATYQQKRQTCQQREPVSVPTDDSSPPDDLTVIFRNDNSIARRQLNITINNTLAHNDSPEAGGDSSTDDNIDNDLAYLANSEADDISSTGSDITESLANRYELELDDVLSIDGDVDVECLEAIGNTISVTDSLAKAANVDNSVEQSIAEIDVQPLESVVNRNTSFNIDQIQTSTTIVTGQTEEDQLLSDIPTDGRLAIVTDQQITTSEPIVSAFEQSNSLSVPTVLTEPAILLLTNNSSQSAANQIGIVHDGIQANALKLKRGERRAARWSQLSEEDQAQAREDLRANRREKKQRRYARLKEQNLHRNHYEGVRKERRREAEARATAQDEIVYDLLEPNNRISVFQRLGNSSQQ